MEIGCSGVFRRKEKIVVDLMTFVYYCIVTTLNRNPRALIPTFMKLNCKRCFLTFRIHFTCLASAFIHKFILYLWH